MIVRCRIPKRVAFRAAAILVPLCAYVDTTSAAASDPPPAVATMNPPLWIGCDLFTGDSQWVTSIPTIAFDGCSSGAATKLEFKATNEGGGEQVLWTANNCSYVAGTTIFYFTLDQAIFPVYTSISIRYDQVGGPGPLSNDVYTLTQPGAPIVFTNDLHDTNPDLACGDSLTLEPPTSYEFAEAWMWGKWVGSHFVPLQIFHTPTPGPFTISNAHSSDAGTYVCSAIVSIGGGCHLLTSPLHPLFLSTPLGGSGAGAGSFIFQPTIPADAPSVTVFLQAFVTDPGSILGYSASNGVRVKMQ